MNMIFCIIFLLSGIGVACYFTIDIFLTHSIIVHKQWSISWAIAVGVDLFIFEMICVAIDAVIISKVGKAPNALGKMRSLILDLGPQAIQKAYIKK